MYSRIRIPMIATALSVLALAAGCLERKETITVAKDGGVTIAIAYKGTAQELETDDALPSAASGWSVNRATIQENNEQKSLLTATRTFAPGEILPRSFANPNDPNAGLMLDFPTTVVVERRPDGAYYHFKRVYSPRPWAYVRYWHDRFIDDDVKNTLKKEEKDLTEDERVKILKAFTSVAAHEQIEFAEAAIRKVAPDMPPHHRLAARKAILDVYDGMNCVTFVRRYQAMTKEDREKSFDKETELLVDHAKDGLRRSLKKDAGFDGVKLDAFTAAYKQAKKLYDVTSQTGAQSFDLSVRLPGKLVAHNGDNVDAEGRVSWQFNGEAFRDRPYELMATSVVKE